MFVSQPGMHASDLRHPATGQCLAPNLCEAATAPSVGSHFDAAEVVGHDFFTALELLDLINPVCSEARGELGFEVELHTLDALPEQRDMRRSKVIENGMCYPIVLVFPLIRTFGFGRKERRLEG